MKSKWAAFATAVCASIALCAVMCFSYAMWQNNKLAHVYKQIRRGNSEVQVLKLLGKPYRVTGRPQNIAWDNDSLIKTNDGVCICEFWYAPPFSIDGESWTIGFDENSNVVSKYHFVSP
jgi:hypothetical protein